MDSGYNGQNPVNHNGNPKGIGLMWEVNDWLVTASESFANMNMLWANNTWIESSVGAA